jgi:ABC-type sugar transport system substrate-binding protein
MTPLIDRRYAVNVAYRNQDFFRQVQDTINKIGSVVPGVEFVFGGPSDHDSNVQVEQVEALISRKVSGILLFPADPAKLVATVNRAVANNIPVVTLFSDIQHSNRLTLVGGPELKSARRLARHVLAKHAHLTGRGAKVIVSFNKPGETVTDLRLQGIRAALESYPGVEIVAVIPDLGDSAVAESRIAEQLTKTPDVKFIFGLNARSAAGAVDALRNASNLNGNAYKPGEVIVTGWDSDQDVLRLIEEGWVYATSVLNSSLCTQIGFSILEAQILGYLHPDRLHMREYSVREVEYSVPEVSYPGVPRKILIPEKLLNRARVAEYREKRKYGAVGSRA